MCAPDRVRVVKITDEDVKCNGCGKKLLELGAFEQTNNKSICYLSTIEHCICKTCKTPFYIEYDIFDENGHLQDYVYTLDPNDPDYRWEDKYTIEHRKLINDHLSQCSICRQKIDDEILENAQFSGFLNGARKALGIKKNGR